MATLVPEPILEYYRTIYPEKLKQYKDIFDEKTAKILAASFEWHEVNMSPQELTKLVRQGILKISPYSSRRRREYMISNFSLLENANETVKREIEHDIDYYFNMIVGYDDMKYLIKRALESEKPVHILLVGPPATAKSLFLEAIYNSQEGAEFTVGPETSNAGLEKLVLEKKPRILLIDELEKAKELSVLLTLMEGGMVRRVKGDDITDLCKIDVRVFGAANSDRRLPPELKSRFLRLYLPEYSYDQFIDICVNYITNEENLNRDVAEIIAQKAWELDRDVRTARHIARLVSNPEDVEKVFRILERYRKI